MLASVGLDSTVWIWDGLTFGRAILHIIFDQAEGPLFTERLRKLDLHQGFVKGVCWDPVGNYLATQVSRSCHAYDNSDTFVISSPMTRR